MNFTHTLPSSWNLSYILNKAGFNLMYSIQEENPDAPDMTILTYTGTQEQYDTIAALIESYPVDYAEEIEKPLMRAKATAKRWEEQQATTYNDMELKCDDVTIGRITAAVVLMDADPDAPQSRRWKLAEDNWATLDKAALVSMGSAIASHVQACFDREEALHIAIDGAANVDELAAIDIDAGW